MKARLEARLLSQTINWLVVAVLMLTTCTANTNVAAVRAQAIPPKIIEKIESLKASEKRWLEINLTTQRLIAWEGNRPVYAVIVSTGKPTTPTPSGVFAIQSKRRLERMRGEDYDLPDVPHAMYFYRGYAIHGTYWHKRFGTPVSHGCINVATDHAQWLFEWAAIGTPVVIHK